MRGECGLQCGKGFLANLTVRDKTLLRLKLPHGLFGAIAEVSVTAPASEVIAELAQCFLELAENHKIIAENSGLLTIAALSHLDCKGKKVVSVISGGNMDVLVMANVVLNGLIQRDRIFTVSVLLPDKPGELARVAALIAELQGNVIKLEHNQFVTTNRRAAVELVITMEAFGTEHKHQIMEALEQAGYQPRLVPTIG